MRATNPLGRLKRTVFTRVVTCALVLGSFLGAAGTPTYAARATPPAPNAAANIDAHLSNVLGREKMWFNVQTSHLTIANEVVKMTQTWIDDLKGKGKDTSTLEAALNAFRQQIGAAQAGHDTAGNLLNAHAGFDDSGHVTDASQARETLKDAHKALADGHRDIRLGRTDFVKVVHQWRQANQPQA